VEGQPIAAQKPVSRRSLDEDCGTSTITGKRLYSRGGRNSCGLRNCHISALTSMFPLMLPFGLFSLMIRSQLKVYRT